MTIKKKLVPVFLILFLGSLVGMAEQTSSASAALTKKQAHALEARANTPQEHLTLSMYYKNEAHKFEREVQYHEEMAEIYRRNPLPYDGKMVVPMQRHCKDLEFYYGQRAERATVLATYHELKALGSEPSASALAQPSDWGLRRTDFKGTNTGGVAIQTSQHQSSLFLDSTAAFAHFYDLARILTYVVSGRGEPSIEMPELRKSAAALFDTQHQFLQSLTEPQRTVIDAPLRTIEKLRREVEHELDQLGNGTASPASGSYFSIAKKLKRNVESWHSEQQEIALQLGIQN